MRDLRLNQKNKYRAQWEYAKGHPTVQSTPPILQIARSNTCNFHCVYCPDHRDGNTVPRFKNEGETWRQLLELIPRSDTLSFHGVSEFMLDPGFFDIVARCRDAHATLLINTNGSVCGPRHLDVLATYPGTLVMNFSLDAATPETFLRVSGWRFDRVLQNIRRYVERFESRQHRTWLSASLVITRTSLDEVTDFVRLAHELKLHHVRLCRLLEYDGLDWDIPTKAGDRFDYRDEYAQLHGDAFNRKLEEARQLAEQYQIYIEVPASGPESPNTDGAGT
jgi:MoaA/NifB/PqqE/SkfB family radical SAM enzyme